MEAKDTVMSIDLVPSIPSNEQIKEVLLRQAEISFKAGQESRDKEIAHADQTIRMLKSELEQKRRTAEYHKRLGIGR